MKNLTAVNKQMRRIKLQQVSIGDIICNSEGLIYGIKVSQRSDELSDDVSGIFYFAHSDIKEHWSGYIVNVYCGKQINII